MTKRVTPANARPSILGCMGLAMVAVVASACEAAASPPSAQIEYYPEAELEPYYPEAEPEPYYPEAEPEPYYPEPEPYYPEPEPEPEPYYPEAEPEPEPEPYYPEEEDPEIDGPEANQTSQYETAALINALVEDSNRFWVQNTDAVSPIAEVPGTPLTGGTHPFVLGESMCGGSLLGNSSGWYCGSDDRVFIDQDYYRSVGIEYGPLPVAFVIGHEWGHAIDHRYGLRSELDYSRDRELFADCLGGAYVSHITSGAIAGLVITSADLAAFERFVTDRLGDPELVDWTMPESHGSGEFRLGHVRQGLENGIEGCGVYYESEAIPMVDIAGVTERSSAGALTITATIDANEFVGPGEVSGDLTVAVYFRHADGTWVAALGTDYRTPDGTLAIATRVAATPGTRNVELSIPLDRFPVGTTEVAIRIQVTDDAGLIYAQTTSGAFAIG